MDEEEVKLLLVKYITGEASAEERLIVKNWVNAHPENEQYFAQLYEAWQNSLLTNPGRLADSDKAYELFLSRTGQSEQKGGNRYKRIAMAIAAVALIAVITVLFRHQTPDTAPVNQLAAQPGKMSRVTLTDGTVVWLNSGSTLKYGADFGKANRTVYLEGEAFFDIAPGKKDRPFLVHTKKYLIRDIGTRFNIKAYANDNFFETAVVNGEVSIEDKGQKDNATNRIYIKQKQTLRIWNRGVDNKGGLAISDHTTSKSYNDIQITQFTADKEENYIGWKDNLLVFDNNTMDEIARVLERRYNVTINIKDTTLQQIRYSGNFKSVPGVYGVLNIIKQNTPIAYSSSGDGVITITKNEN